MLGGFAPEAVIAAATARSIFAPQIDHGVLPRISMKQIFAAIVALFPTCASASLLDMHDVQPCQSLSDRASILDETKAVLDRMIEGVPEVPVADRERFHKDVARDLQAHETLKSDRLYRASLVRDSYDPMVRFIQQSKADDPRETIVGAGMVLLLMPDLLEAIEAYGGLNMDHVRGIRYSASTRLGTLIECSVRSLPLPR